MSEQNRRAKIEQLFDEAMSLESGERDAFLEHACAGDTELAGAVRKLMAADAASTKDVRDALVNDAAALTDAAEPAERRIGPYVIRSQLGEGGFGYVYLAEQTEPVRRRVALKVIKPGMDTKAVLARFEAERQALALMDHPCIAKVFDAGRTDAGRPFFVMELVEGESITTFCDRHKLGIDARVTLFREVCEAVQHAHQKGVLHRDIKPNNVLVRYEKDKAVPKVIDFGVAKAINQPLTEQTIFTEQGQLIGTPEYMSPEQAEMTALNVDTRSDVYSLGVLLYELLTGRLPFETATLRRAGLAEIQRIIREVDPPKPSTRLTTAIKSGPSAREDLARIAAARRMQVRELPRQIRGDLDWIVMRALEKERTRRYPTADSFSEDLARFLKHEPVMAGPPSAAYRTRKFVRRNRGAVAAVVVVFAVATAGAVTTSLQARRATAARDVAMQRDLAGRELARVLLGGVHDEVSRLRGSTSALNSMAEAASTYLDGLVDASRADQGTLLEVSIGYRRLGDVLGGSVATNLGETPRALDSYDRSIELLEGMVTTAGEQARQQALLARAGLLTRLGRIDDAERDMRLLIDQTATPAEATRSQLLVRMSALIGLGDILKKRGRTEEAREQFEQALQTAGTSGDPDAQKAEILTRLGVLDHEAGSLEAAEQFLSEALAIRRAVVSGSPNDSVAQRDLLWALYYSGVLEFDLGNVALASELLDESRLIARRRLTGDRVNLSARRDAALVMRQIADFEFEIGDLDAAEDSYAAIVPEVTAISNEDPGSQLLRLELAQVLERLARTNYENGNYQAATDTSAEAIQLFRTVLAESSTHVAARRGLANALVASGPARRVLGDPRTAMLELGEAVSLCDDLLAELADDLLIAQDWVVAHYEYALACRDGNDVERAITSATQALRMLSQYAGDPIADQMILEMQQIMALSN